MFVSNPSAMAPSMSRIYILSSDHIGIFFVATNKKIAFDFLYSNSKLRPKTIPNYWSFSQLIKYNPVCVIHCQSCDVLVTTRRVNMDYRMEETLFT